MNTPALLSVALFGIALVSHSNSAVPGPAIDELKDDRALTRPWPGATLVQTSTTLTAHGSERANAAHRKIVRWGPFQIPAATNKGPGVVAYPGFKLEMPCS